MEAAHLDHTSGGHAFREAGLGPCVIPYFCHFLSVHFHEKVEIRTKERQHVLHFPFLFCLFISLCEHARAFGGKS